MDITTKSVKISCSSDPAGAIIQVLCDFWTPDEPRTPTEAEKWAALRQVRGELLAACDWTQVLDAPLTSDQQASWEEYRQDLRDITATYATPESVIFPEVPNG